LKIVFNNCIGRMSKKRVSKEVFQNAKLLSANRIPPAPIPTINIQNLSINIQP
jgi:hypothetical protein